MKKIAIIMMLGVAMMATAKVRLPQLFQNGMVLQRNADIPVWGWADAGEQVAVQLLGNKGKMLATATATTGADGRWQLQLPKKRIRTGGPYRLAVNDITLDDVLVGDVWLCSGQSNIDVTVERVYPMYAADIDSYENTQVRLFRVQNQASTHGELSDIGLTATAWLPASKANAWQFSAVGYFLGRRMHEAHGVPQGIIVNSWGGTPIEAWISADSLKAGYPLLVEKTRLYDNPDYVAAQQQANQLMNDRWFRLLNERDPFPGPLQKFVPVGQYELPQLLAPYCQGGDFIGSVWLAQHLHIDSRHAGQPARLLLGTLYDQDYTYINGQEVGRTYYQYPPRRYQVSQGLLHEGENLLMVRFVNKHGVPHFIGEKPYMLIFDDGDTLRLGEQWAAQVGTTMPPCPGADVSLQNLPSTLYNAVLRPLAPYALAGVVWYQGESNTGNAHDYAPMLRLLMQNWRQAFANPQLPFAIVELANFQQPVAEPQNTGWSHVREAQRTVALADPWAEAVVNIDLGETTDIHPLRKREVAQRVALCLDRLVFGSQAKLFPQVVDARVNVNDAPAGLGHACTVTVVLTLDQPLRTCDDLKYFELAGADGQFHNVKARADGNIITLFAPMAQPATVRYAWKDNPLGVDAYGLNGLPLGPFEMGLGQ